MKSLVSTDKINYSFCNVTNKGIIIQDFHNTQKAVTLFLFVTELGGLQMVYKICLKK